MYNKDRFSFFKIVKEVIHIHTKIKEIVNRTKEKYNLTNYHLYEYHIYRRINIYNETEYHLSMEWFPQHINERIEEDLNPEGAAAIEINIHTGQTESIIFVGGNTYVTEPVFKSFCLDETVKFIEAETGLKFGEQFILTTEEKNRVHFQSVINGTSVSPSGQIEIECDSKGRLLHYSVYNPFPTKDEVKIENYSLKPESVKSIILNQLKLIEFPSEKDQKLIPVYGIEEIFITNNGSTTIPFDLLKSNREITIDKRLKWQDCCQQNKFERIPLNFQKEITIEQALASEPHPDAMPITDVEKKQCESLVEDFLREVYPNDSEKWVLRTLHRDHGYIYATLRSFEQSNQIFQRKLLIMIESKTLKVHNYMDNMPLIELYDSYERTDPIKVEKETAYERLKHMIELKPTYVYDDKNQQFILCGKLDSEYGIHAVTGEIVLLNDL